MKYGFGKKDDDFSISVRVLFWNVNGFTDLIKSAEVSAWLYKNFDVCFVSETHMRKGQSFKVDNFKCSNHPSTDALGSKARGGIMCMIKTEFVQHVIDVKLDTTETIIVTFRGGHKIFGTYIPPVSSVYYEETSFTCIPNIFVHDDQNHVIIGGGDLNSRVGDIKQKLPLSNAQYRPNVDTQINSHGKLLKICASYDCYILNNLDIGTTQCDGDFTFFKGGRKSQNDICLSNSFGLRNVEDFTIHKIGWNFSDHFPISTTVKLDLYDSSVPVSASADILSSLGDEANKRTRKIHSSLVDWEGYSVIASREIEMLQCELDSLSAKPDSEKLNVFVEKLTSKLYKTAQTCERRPEHSIPVIPELSPSMVNANEVLIEYSAGLCSWETWDGARKEAVSSISKRLCTEQIDAWGEVLGCDDSKKIWDRIDWKGHCKGDDITNEFPELESLAEQFQSKDNPFDTESLSDMDFGNNKVPLLDGVITTEELEAASKRLKEGKSTADGWVPRMITEIGGVLYPILLILFNIILSCSVIPVKWLYSIVIALFKNKGTRRFAKFFRPVSLVEMLSKLFDFVLLGRFQKWFTPHDMQTAYQTGKGPGDHIFFMRCLIELFNKTNRKLFITAIDFDGAFDRVKRSTLLKKLLLFGAGSVFVSCLANLYSVSGNVIYNNGASVTYMLYSGIKQGLPLSPYLFLFYIDDVFAYLEKVLRGKGTDLFDDLHILIHADDANLIATSKESMLMKLKSMLDFCKLNSIILQLLKCHFIVINGTLADRASLRLSGNDTVAVGYESHLEILGSHISGSIVTDLELHLKKRFCNVIKYFNYIRSNQLAPVVVKLKVLKSCVMTALLYNCEAFGPHVPKGLEELYIRMLRAALGVRHNCPKLTVLIESGFLPLKCLILSRQLKFFRRFKDSLCTNSVRAKIFDYLLKNTSKFLDHYIDLDIRYSDHKQLIRESVDDLKDNIRKQAANKGRHYKYWVYLQMNPELTASPYLPRIDVVGKSMIKFRLGSHRLKIETGRWSNIPRDERLCTSCNLLEDEYHVIYDCCKIDRADLVDIPQPLSSLWSYSKVNTLFKRIRDAEYVT